TCRGGPADPASRAQCVAPSALEPSGPGSAGGRAPVVSRAQVHEERGHVAVPHPAEALRSAQRRRTRTLQRFAALGGQARYPAEVDVRDRPLLELRALLEVLPRTLDVGGVAH